MPSPSSASRDPAGADPLASHRHSMAVWAEPVIADRILGAYEECDIGPSFRSLVAIHHRRLWRALILEKRELADRIRGELVLDLTRAGLSADILAEIDDEVMEELMDIVFRRFRSSRDMAMGFSRVLLSAASTLGAVRPLAA